MSLTPVIYVDNETVIGAQNLNAIQDAILANEQGLANKVSTSDYNPSAKTSAMTQEVGKDANGKLWTNPSGGAGLVIKGYYLTLQALIAAVPNPSLGDTYGVGSAAPYEIYMWDGTQWVDNGTIKGEKGDDGYSPEVTITQTATGHDVTITDEEHPSGQTFSVNNGTNGTDGEDGDDGFSPVVSSAPITGGTRVSIQDATHTETFDVLNGTGSGDMQTSVYDSTSAVATAGGIPAYVNANGGKIDHIQLNGTEQTITNKTVNLTPSATDVAYGQSNVGAELTSQSSQIVLKADKTAITNPNLLDNPWFTVNQRGASSWSTGYGVDRWKIGSGTAATVNSDNTITFPSGVWLTQLTEASFMNNLLGKSVTLTILFSDGAIEKGTITLTLEQYIQAFTGDRTDGYIYVNGTHSSNPYGVSINTKQSCTIKAIKLELGSISTLAMDTAPNYAEELLKCQRYFYAAFAFGGFKSNAAGTEADGYVNFPVPMRVTPTITCEDIGMASGGGEIGTTNLQISLLPHGIRYLYYGGSAVFNVNQMYFIHNLQASADL